MNKQQTLDLLTVAFGGREVEITGTEFDGFTVAVHSDDRRHHCDFMVTRSDLNMKPSDFADRIVAPMVATLDGVAFPKRGERLMAAHRRIAENFSQDAIVNSP